jgi:hypothetical protein
MKTNIRIFLTILNFNQRIRLRLRTLGIPVFWSVVIWRRGFCLFLSTTLCGTM